MTIYPESLAELERACVDYRSKMIGIEQLQSIVWKVSQDVLTVEERELRRYLQNTESKIDLLRFTVDQEHLFEKTLDLIKEVESYIQIMRK